MPRRQARTKMPKRKPGKSSKAQRKAQRKVTKKKPVKRKSSGKKQDPPLKYVHAVLKELKKENSKASLRDAIPIAKKSYKKGQTADSWNVSTSKYSTVSMPKKAETLSLPMSSQGSYDLDAWMPGKKKGKKGKKKSNTSVLTNQTDKFDSFLDGIEN